jgi:hypothetical protein
MDAKTIATLNATPPPRRYLSATEAHARIAELETELGIFPGKPLYKLTEFNERIEMLERMKSARIGTRPGKSPAVTQDVMAQYTAITDPAKKVAFYRENAQAMDAAHKDRKLPATSPTRTPPSAADFEAAATYGQISHPVDKVSFYRANAAAIDRVAALQNQ